jgi:cell division protein FtsQ
LAERSLTRAGFRDPRVVAGLKLLIAVLVIWVIGVGAPRLLHRLEFFRIRRLEIAGLHYLTPAKVVTALGLGAEATVFEDLAPANRGLRALPGVVSAEVRRRFPGTLEIVLAEAVPVALAPRGGGMALLDSRGNVLPFDPAASAPDLPVAATADRKVAGVLASVQESDPVLFGKVRTAWRVRDDVLLDVDGRRLWFTAAVTAEDIRAVMEVARDLARQGRTYQELDGRYAGQVIVRGRA